MLYLVVLERLTIKCHCHYLLIQIISKHFFTYEPKNHTQYNFKYFLLILLGWYATFDQIRPTKINTDQNRPTNNKTSKSRLFKILVTYMYYKEVNTIPCVHHSIHHICIIYLILTSGIVSSG